MEDKNPNSPMPEETAPVTDSITEEIKPVPTASDLRAEARIALRGNWKIALGTTVIAMLIYSVLNDALSSFYDQIAAPFISGAANVNSIGGFLFASFFLAFFLLLLTPLYTLVLARVSRAAVTHKPIRTSMMRFSISEILRACRLELVIAWRVALLPMLLWGGAYAVIVLILTLTNIPSDVAQPLTMLLSVAYMITLIVVMCARSLSHVPVYQLFVIDPDASARELSTRSIRLMKENRVRSIILHLSFFGWLLLYNLLAEGVGYLLGDLQTTNYLAFSLINYAMNLASLPLSLYIITADAAFTRDLLERE